MWVYVLVFLAGNVTSVALLFVLVLRVIQQATEKNEKIINEGRVDGAAKIQLPIANSANAPASSQEKSAQPAAKTGETVRGEAALPMTAGFDLDTEDAICAAESVAQPFHIDGPSKEVMQQMKKAKRDYKKKTQTEKKIKKEDEKVRKEEKKEEEKRRKNEEKQRKSSIQHSPSRIFLESKPPTDEHSSDEATSDSLAHSPHSSRSESTLTPTLTGQVQGWLGVKRMKFFHKRWCVINGSKLIYCNKPTSTTVRGIVNLYKCEIHVLGKRTKGYKFKLMNPAGEEIFEAGCELLDTLGLDYESLSESDSESFKGSPMVSARLQPPTPSSSSSSGRNRILVKDSKRFCKSEMCAGPNRQGLSYASLDSLPGIERRGSALSQLKNSGLSRSREDLRLAKESFKNKEKERERKERKEKEKEEKEREKREREREKEEKEKEKREKEKRKEQEKKEKKKPHPEDEESDEKKRSSKERKKEEREKKKEEEREEKERRKQEKELKKAEEREEKERKHKEKEDEKERKRIEKEAERKASASKLSALKTHHIVFRTDTAEEMNMWVNFIKQLISERDAATLSSLTATSTTAQTADPLTEAEEPVTVIEHAMATDRTALLESHTANTFTDDDNENASSNALPSPPGSLSASAGPLDFEAAFGVEFHPTDIELTGWLEMKLLSQFVRHWFVLQGVKLFYFADQESHSAQHSGCIELLRCELKSFKDTHAAIEGITTSGNVSSSGMGHAFKLKCKEEKERLQLKGGPEKGVRKVILRAEDEIYLHTWIEHIEKAIKKDEKVAAVGVAAVHQTHGSSREATTTTQDIKERPLEEKKGENEHSPSSLGEKTKRRVDKNNKPAPSPPLSPAPSHRAMREASGLGDVDTERWNENKEKEKEKEKEKRKEKEKEKEKLKEKPKEKPTDKEVEIAKEEVAKQMNEFLKKELEEVDTEQPRTPAAAGTTGGAGGVAGGPTCLEQTYFNPSDHIRLHALGYEECEWFNIILERDFRDMQNSPIFKDHLLARLQRKFDTQAARRPSFLGPVIVSQVDIGSEFLKISKIKMLRGTQPNEVVGEALLAYGGGFTMSVTTKIYVKNLVTVPVKLTLTVKSLSGKMHIYGPAQLQERFMASFVEMPNCEFAVTFSVGDKKSHELNWLPKVDKYLVSTIKRFVKERMVFPNRLSFNLPFPGRKMSLRTENVTKRSNRPRTDRGAPGLSSNSDPTIRAMGTAVERFFEFVLNRSMWKELPALCHEDVITSGFSDDVTSKNTLQRYATTLKSLKSSVHSINKTFDSLKWINSEQSVDLERQKVWCRFELTGVWRAPFWRIMPSFTKAELGGFMIFTFRDGKIERLEICWDVWRLLNAKTQATLQQSQQSQQQPPSLLPPLQPPALHLQPPSPAASPHTVGLTHVPSVPAMAGLFHPHGVSHPQGEQQHAVVHTSMSTPNLPMYYHATPAVNNSNNHNTPTHHHTTTPTTNTTTTHHSNNNLNASNAVNHKAT